MLAGGIVCLPDAVLDAGGVRAGGFDCLPGVLLDASAIVDSRSSETALIRVASA